MSRYDDNDYRFEADQMGRVTRSGAATVLIRQEK